MRKYKAQIARESIKNTQSSQGASGEEFFFSSGGRGALGALHFRGGTNILSWQAPSPHPLKNSHVKSPNFWAEQDDKQTNRGKGGKIITFVGGGGGGEKQPFTNAKNSQIGLSIF